MSEQFRYLISLFGGTYQFGGLSLKIGISEGSGEFVKNEAGEFMAESLECKEVFVVVEHQLRLGDLFIERVLQEVFKNTLLGL